MAGQFSACLAPDVHAHSVADVVVLLPLDRLPQQSVLHSYQELTESLDTEVRPTQAPLVE